MSLEESYLKVCNESLCRAREIINLRNKLKRADMIIRYCVAELDLCASELAVMGMDTSLKRLEPRIKRIQKYLYDGEANASS